MEKQEFERQLSAVREEIDRIDKQLLPLFLERMNCSEKVAEIKQQAGIPVLNAKREQEILDRVRERLVDTAEVPRRFILRLWQ